jgi:hypothetical protein
MAGFLLRGFWKAAIVQSIATNFHPPMEFSFSVHLFFTDARVDDHR